MSFATEQVARIETLLAENAGVKSVVVGNTTVMTATSATESIVHTDIPNARSANAYVGARLQTGDSSFSVVGVTNSDITNLRIVTGKATTISGRVVFEGTSARSNDTTPLRVMAQQSDPSRQLMMFPSGDPLANGVLDDQGNFQLSGVSGRVFVALSTPPTWVLKSITVDGEDMTDTPLDLAGRPSMAGVVIRMTDKLSQVSGQVSDARGQVLKDYVVVVLPAEQKEPVVAARWTRTVRPDSNGRFITRGLRPGRYVATALETIEQGRQFAPEFQEQLRRAAREFLLREGESITVDLRLTPGL